MHGTQLVERTRKTERVRNEQHDVKLDRRRAERERQSSRSNARNRKQLEAA